MRQSIRYVRNYHFNDDILIPLSRGVPNALSPLRADKIIDCIHLQLLGEYSAACRKTPDRGPCKGRFEVYYFDSATQSCKAFIWGGCQNSVPFQSQENCQNTCRASPQKE